MKSGAKQTLPLEGLLSEVERSYRRHRPDLMPHRRDLARPMMRCGAGLDADETGWQFLEEGKNPTAS